MRSAVWLFVLLSSAATCSELAGRLDSAVVRENEGVAWRELLNSRPCGPNPPTSTSCTQYAAIVRNDSLAPIQCRASLVTAQGAGDDAAERLVVVAPGGIGVPAGVTVFESVAPIMTTECRPVPATASSFEETPDCDVRIEIDLSNAYPPGPLSRGEMGEAEVEFTAAAGTTSVRDVVLVKSSGFAELDQQAIEIARALSLTTRCADHRVRRAISFDVGPEPAIEKNGFVFSSTSSVLVSPAAGIAGK